MPLVESVPAITNDPATSRIVTPAVALGVSVKLAHVAPSVTVAVNGAAPDAASKMALSTDVGTDAPDAPPDVADHLVVLFQLPDPPTQYLSAMSSPHITHAVNLDVIGRRFLHRRGCNDGDPVVPPLLLHGLDIVLREGVIIRQMKSVTEHPVRGVKLEVDLEHDQANVKIAPGVVFENLTVNVSPSASVMPLP